MSTSAASTSTSAPRVQRGFVAARAVGSFVPKLTHKAFAKYGFAAAALITDWATIVGKDVAAYASPERLKWPRGAGAIDNPEDGYDGQRGATLILRVEAARALDIQYRAQQLIERINRHFGYRAVGELRIIQAPRVGSINVPETSQRAGAPIDCVPAPELSGISDERLRAALSALKSGMMAQSQRR
jgi:hypothetical protein